MQLVFIIVVIVVKVISILVMDEVQMRKFDCVFYFFVISVQQVVL